MAQLLLVPLATAIGVPASELAVELEREIAEPCASAELPVPDGSDDAPDLTPARQAFAAAEAPNRSPSNFYCADCTTHKQFYSPAVRAPPARV